MTALPSDSGDRLGAPLRRPALRTILLRRFLLLAAIPVLVLGALQGVRYLQERRASAEERLEEVARLLAAEIDDHLGDHVRALETTAQVLVDPAADAPEWLRDTHRRYPGFLTLLVTDAAGTLTATSPRLSPTGENLVEQGENVADREYFRQAVEGRAYVSPAFLGRGFGSDPIVAASVPLLRESAPVGVVEGSLNLARLTRPEDRFPSVPGLEVLIADGEGTIVYASPDSGFASLDPAPGGTALRSAEPGSAGFLAAAAEAESVPWTVFVRQPRHTVYADALRFLGFTLVAITLGLLAAALVAAQSALQISRPLRDLAALVRRPARGEAPAVPDAPPGNAPREVAELYEGFARLARDLGQFLLHREETLTQLEHQAVTRAADVEKERATLFDFLETAHDLVMSIAPDGRFLFVNRSWRDTLGYDRGEINRRRFLDLVAPEDRETCRREIAFARQGREARYLAATLLAADGRRVAVEGHLICRFEDGVATAIRGILRDVTREQEAFAALAEREERYRRLFQDSFAWIATHDLEGRLLSVNPVACEALQRSEEELVGIPIVDLVVPEERDAFREYLLRIREQGHHEGSRTVQTGSGERRTVLYRNRLVQPPGEEPFVIAHGIPAASGLGLPVGEDPPKRRRR